MNSLRLEPISSVAGVVNLPGSKSVSNRALLLAALARGTTRLTNLLDSDDIRHMLAALTQLGVKYKLSADKTECTVHGLGRSFAVSAPVNLFLGNAGTAMRPLCAALCLGSGEYMLGGEPRMEERPIGHLVDALREAGAHIQYLKKDGYPPLVVDAKGLWGGEHIMKQFGVVIEHDDYKVFYIKGNQTYVSPGDFLVEGDASSASYFLAAGAIKGKVRVTGIGKHSIQGDIHFADVLEKMGARITWGDDFIEAEQAPLHGVDMDMNHIPDAAMTIAVAALFAKGPTAIRNIYNWRVKETDRLHAMATELRKLGVEVEEGHDFIAVTPPEQLKHAEIDTYNDHRIAMCFSLVALSDTAVTINDPGCTSKTFPDYFTKLASISQA